MIVDAIAIATMSGGVGSIDSSDEIRLRNHGCRRTQSAHRISRNGDENGLCDQRTSHAFIALRTKALLHTHPYPLHAAYPHASTINAAVFHR